MSGHLTSGLIPLQGFQSATFTWLFFPLGGEASDQQDEPQEDWGRGQHGQMSLLCGCPRFCARGYEEPHVCFENWLLETRHSSGQEPMFESSCLKWQVLPTSPTSHHVMPQQVTTVLTLALLSAVNFSS